MGSPARPASRRTVFLVSCEHGGNRVPAAYRQLFRGQRALLDSHRGFDHGALLMARRLARDLGARLEVAKTTRLLVDLNRSTHHPRFRSRATATLSADEHGRLLQRHYYPYRRRIEAWIAGQLAQGRRVVHISSHSFTPVMRGQRRNADIGLLYDPGRSQERALAMRLRQSLLTANPRLRVRRNYPYLGTADGLTTAMRRRFPDGRYAGIELEVSQRYPRSGGRAWSALRRDVSSAFSAALGVLPGGPAHAGTASAPPRRRRISSQRL